MTWTKEDEQKIRSLILNDDVDSVHVGISLAIYTLGMTVKELVDLIDESCIKIVGRDIKEGVAFGDIIKTRTSDKFIIDCLKEEANRTIANYLNELTQEERFNELLKSIKNKL